MKQSVPIVPVVRWAHHERIYSQSRRFVQRLTAVQSSRFKRSRKEQFDRNFQVSGIDQASPSPLLTPGFRGQESFGLSMLNYLVHLGTSLTLSSRGYGADEIGVRVGSKRLD